MHSHHDYDFFPVNFLLSLSSSAVAFFVSTLDPVITGLVLPIAFFTVGKIVDICVKVYIERKK